MYVVFAGAGASIAVDKNQYPTTLEFFERLPDQIKTNNSLAHEFKRCQSALKVFRILHHKLLDGASDEV